MAANREQVPEWGLTQFSRDEWLALRGKGIGASDAPVICGLSPFKDPYTLWAEKTGQLPPQEETFPMWWGHAVETAISDRYVLETGNFVTDPGDFAVMRADTHPFLFCTPDRIGRDELGRPMPVELKCVTAYSAQDWRDSQAPLQYQAQLQFQMYILGAMRGDLAAVVGNTELVVVRYERNERFIAAMLPKLIEFWGRVQANDPPPVETRGGMKTWESLHLDDSGEERDLDQDAIAAYHAWTKAKEEKKEAEANVEHYADQLKLAIGEASYGLVGNTARLAYKRVDRRGSLGVAPELKDALDAAGVPYRESKPSSYRQLREVKAK